MASSPAKRPADDPGASNPQNKRPKKDKEKEKDRPKEGEKSSGSKKDKKLNPEVELQQSLLSSDPQLAQRFLQARREKPESLSDKQFAKQFWAQRSHLLRAHAIEREQKRAGYNVLSEVKPRNVEGAVKLNITPEQVEDIFRQHPVVRKAYDETVPNHFRDNMSFWSKFFVSRLFKKLKGERVTDGDATDPYLDRYMNYDREVQKAKEQAQQHIPHFIDLEGNEQNHSQRRGNAPDVTMRPNTNEKVPILRTLNDMSQNLLTRVKPVEGNAHAPIGMDEETYNQLRLQDLQSDDTPEQRPKLDPSKRFANSGDSRQKSVKQQHQPRPEDVQASLKHLQSSASTTLQGGTLDLASAIGFPASGDDDDDDDEDNSDSDSDSSPETTHTSKKDKTHSSNSNTPNKKPQPLSLRTTTTHITTLITAAHSRSTSTAHTTHTYTSASKPGQNGVPTPYNLDPSLYQELTLSHHTTNEFLSYIWSLMAPALSSSSASSSGKSSAAATTTLKNEIPALLSTLDNSLRRLDKVAQDAESKREERLRDLRSKAAAVQQQQAQRTGGKRAAVAPKIDEAAAGPGKREVNWLVTPLTSAIDFARAKFAEITGGVMTA
ncbi:MAG: RNA polymerase II transcription factor B subunit 1 [Alyxoria varia]|nr:MAG: RNA polymerase II transcription factor B subunit 1 [Alyxoria varia]